MFDALDIFYKGLIIGIVVSAPLGPVGVLCIQRTLNKGRWYGFVTGVGAAMSDLTYALITGFGMSLVADFLSQHIKALQILGSIMLFVFGLYTFKSKPKRSIRPSSGVKGTYMHNLATAFMLTLSNPLIIFLFIGLYARFGFLSPEETIFEHVAGYCSIAAGALLWWFVTTYAINKVKKRFDVRGIWTINRGIGIMVMLISAIALTLTCTGKSLY